MHHWAEDEDKKHTRGGGAGRVRSGGVWVLTDRGFRSELGPAILMPDKRVFCVGASGHTALYNVKTGAWSAGPDFPTDSGGNLLRAFDAPAALLPNGHVLCVAGAAGASGGNPGGGGFPLNLFAVVGAGRQPLPAAANPPHTRPH